MRNNFLVAIILLFCSSLAYAQLDENFEGTDFPPQGWQVEHLLGVDNNRNGWTRVEQSGDNFPQGGKYVACSTTGQNMDDSDSWLISPAVSVGTGDVLSFYIMIDGADYNTDNVFEVLLSENGTDKSDFTTSLLRIEPENPMKWSHYFIDLSQYAGREVHIAFHDQLISPVSFVSGCRIYIDNVSVGSEYAPDLGLRSILSPASDCADFQFVRLEVQNTGRAVSQFTVHAQLNGRDVMTQTVNEKIGYNETKVIELEEPLELQSDLKSSFRVWLECEGDTNASNDEAVSEIYVRRQIPFPYVMNESQSKSLDLFSFGIFSNWMFMPGMEDNDSIFVFVGKVPSPVLGTSCIDLPQSRVRISFDYSSTQAVNMTVYDATNPSISSYKNVAGISPELSGDGNFHSVSFTVDIASGGLQSLGFCVTPLQGASSSMLQFILSNLVIEEAVDDVELSDVLSPGTGNVFITGKPMPVVVRVGNLGASDMGDVTVSYQLDDRTVVSEQLGSALVSGQETDYRFKQSVQLQSTGKHSLKVWVDAAGDTNHANDTLTHDFTVFERENMPYYMGFEEGENIDEWEVVNSNNDQYMWCPAGFGMSGQNSMCITSVRDVTHNDMIVSPAIHLTEGDVRFACFYYLTTDGSTQMDILFGNDNHPDSLATVIYSDNKETNGWISRSIILNIEKEGDYYFAVRAQGENGSLYLDDVRVDQGMDASMRNVEFVTREHYNLGMTDVRLSFCNNGVKAIDRFKLSYQLSGGSVVSETISQQIKPGETFTYTFKEQADLSEKRVYNLTGKVEVDGDVESANDAMYISFEHYPNKTLPYFEAFDDDVVRYRWESTVVDVAGDGVTWVPAGNATYDAYSGGTCLYYSTLADADDWIFSECVEIPAGTYEMSFFYRTFKNFADRKESFRIMLGTAQTPESMSIEIVDMKDVSVSDPQEHKKVCQTFTVPESGNYYIGFQAYSKKTNGYIVIDDILIQEPPVGREPFYESDFSERMDEWTRYRLNSYVFDQWNSVYDKNKGKDILQLQVFRVYEPSYVVSPLFTMQAGVPVDLEVEYSLVTDNSADRLGLYMGTANHPDSISELVAELVPSKEWSVSSNKIQVDRDGDYVFAVKPLRAGTEQGAVYSLATVRLTPSGLKGYAVNGRITDIAGNPVDGASVSLIGGRSYAATTGSDGRFVIEGVIEQQSFSMKVGKELFKAYSEDLIMSSENMDMGDITLEYDTQSPVNVNAVYDESSNQVSLSWMAPGSIVEYRYDDGRCYGNVGFNNGNSESVVGRVIKEPVSLHEVSWYTVSVTNLHEKVNLFVLALDDKGMPTSEILFEQRGVANKDMEWSSLQFEEPVDAPSGCMIALSYDGGSVNLGIDDGIDDYPFQNNTCYVGNVTSGKFQTLESQGGKSNFMIRALGTPMSGMKKVVSEETVYRYIVYRIAESDIDDESRWLQLTDEPQSDVTFVDDVKSVKGMYLYGVRTVYPTDERSEVSFSAPLELLGGSGIETTGYNEVTVRLAGDELQIDASEVIDSYSVYDVSGRYIAGGEGGSCQIRRSVQGWTKGLNIVIVNTCNGRYSAKIQVR